MYHLFSTPRPISKSADESIESEIFQFIDTHVAYDPMLQSIKSGRCPFIKSALKRNLIFYSEASTYGLENPSFAVLQAADWFVVNMSGVNKASFILAFPYLDSDSQIEKLWLERNPLLDQVASSGLTGALSYRRKADVVVPSSGHHEQPSTPFWVLRFL